MKQEIGITKNQILSELSRSPHGKLSEYIPVGQKAAKEEPEFLAHLIAWDKDHGQIRDAKAALPVVALTVPTQKEFVENALAHMALLNPREFLKAYRFALEVRTPGNGKGFRRLAEQYLRKIEEYNWDRTALQHRAVLKELYALTHTKPSPRANRVLFKGEYPPHSIFETVAQLKNMSPIEAAGTIMEKKIPFLIAMGALGPKAKEQDLVLALIGRMTSTELITNTKMLEKLGVKTVPALRAAYEQGLEKASKSSKSTLKTTRASQAMTDEGLKAKLAATQESQIAASKGIEGNWLVLGDKSGSMENAIEISRNVAATLAKYVKGTVSLVFFDTSPRFIDATGKTLEQLLALTKNIDANGGTSIGCGLLAAIERKVEIDGIAIVSDGMENNSPLFVDQYKALVASTGKQIPVYFYHCDASMSSYSDRFFTRQMEEAKLDLQVFDLTKGVDYYSIPDIVHTMRANRYSLIDEIFATPLLTLKAAFAGKEVAHAVD